MNEPPKQGISQGLATAVLLIMGTFWGLQFAMLKLAVGERYSDLAILTLSLSLLSVIFLSALVVRGELFAVSKDKVVFLLVTSVLGYIAPLWAALYAAAHIPAGILTLLASLSPIVTVAIALAMRTEVVSGRRILAVLLGSVAVCLVLWPELELPGFGKMHWILIGLVMPLCYGAESIYIAKFWPRGLTPLQAVTGETVTAAVLVLPIFLIVDGSLSIPTAMSKAEWAIALFVAAGVVESMLYFYLISKTGGVFVTFAGFVSLFAGIGWGVLLFAEIHGATVWIAVGLLCVSLFLACWQRGD